MRRIETGRNLPVRYPRSSNSLRNVISSVEHPHTSSDIGSQISDLEVRKRYRNHSSEMETICSAVRYRTGRVTEGLGPLPIVVSPKIEPLQELLGVSAKENANIGRASVK